MSFVYIVLSKTMNLSYRYSVVIFISMFSLMTRYSFQPKSPLALKTARIL